MRSSCWYAIAIGLAVGGWIGAFWATFFLVGFASAIVLAFAVHPWVHQQLGTDPRRRARLEGQQHRLKRLAAASASTTQVNDLAVLVDKIACTHGESVVAQRGLVEVLDAYTDLVIARTTYERVLHGTDRTALANDLAILTRRDDDASLLRRRCTQHRLEHWDACVAAAERCTAEMSALTEYVHLVGERAITADVFLPTHELEQRLDEVEGEHLALIELTGNA